MNLHITSRIIRYFLALALVAITAEIKASIISWSSASGSAWLSTNNWSGNTVPGTNDEADFGIPPTGNATVTINMSNPTNNGTTNQAVGAIVLTPSRTNNLTINDSNASGIFTLNGATVNSVANVILRNANSNNFTIQDGSSSIKLNLVLSNTTDNRIYIDGSGNLTISDSVSSLSGVTPMLVAGIGSGVFTLSGTANSFTGDINIVGGETRFAADGSLGNASNSIIIDGGRIGSVSGGSVNFGA